MHLIVYTSESTGDASHISNTLTDINNIARQRNPELGITGVLFYQSGRFLQVIEGKQNHLETLMGSIEQDSRHENIERLIDEPTQQRGFSQWNMDTFNLSHKEAIDPQELRNISEAFRQTVQNRSDLLTRFYKAMLISHKLKDFHNHSDNSS